MRLLTIADFIVKGMHGQNQHPEALRLGEKCTQELRKIDFDYQECTEQ